MAFKALCALFLLCTVVYQALGHGYIKDPPARNACWQYGFSSCGEEWTMDEKNCGAVSTQWNKNRGKCGVCGDPYHIEVQKYVIPGSHATGTITRTYNEGQEFDLVLMITVTHNGWSEFRIGDIGIPPITQDKLSHLLQLSTGGTRWNHNKYVKGKKGEYKIKLRLPAGLTCSQCVIQWWWKTGNSWGCDSEGCGLGHGPQETFVNCADVRIINKGAPIPTTPVKVTIAPTKPSATLAPAGPCKAVGAWKGNPTMDVWCNSNCPANCPQSVCSCA